jgi:Ca-activated chloride channel family protein
MKKIALFFLCVFSLFQFTPAQKGVDDVIRVDTSLVRVPVTVTDEQGRFIPGLKREDFKLFEDGKPQEITYFDADDAPFTVVLILDMSDSTRFKLEEIQDAAQAFVDQLRPADKVALFTFDSYVFKALEATSDRAKIKNAIYLSRSGGGTSLYSAVSEVAGNYLKGIKGRRAIVLFTDGIDTTSPDEKNFDSTAKFAQATDAIIFSIQYDTVRDMWKGGRESQNAKSIETAQVQIVTKKGERLDVAYKRGTQFLMLLAHESGGKFHFASSVAGLTESFARIAQTLKEQYSIGFYPANQNPDGKQHGLKVEFTGDAKNKIKYRRGYLLIKESVPETK